MEEDEEDQQQGGTGVLEKGAAERGKDEEEEEEEAGITFKVRVSSTPDERREKKHTVSPLPVSLLSPTPLTLPEPPAASSSVTSVLSLTALPCPVTEKTSQSSKPIPGACTTAVQSQSQICSSASTTASSSGKYYVKYCKIKSFGIVFLINFVIHSVQNPGKCQSSTFSTYTFTTCRILHPSDVTQVTSRSVFFEEKKVKVKTEVLQ